PARSPHQSRRPGCRLRSPGPTAQLARPARTSRGRWWRRPSWCSQAYGRRPSRSLEGPGVLGGGISPPSGPAPTTPARTVWRADLGHSLGFSLARIARTRKNGLERRRKRGPLTWAFGNSPVAETRRFARG